jgi:competence protein ComEC
MRSAILGFVAGILWLQNQATLPSPLLLWTIAGAALLAGLALRGLPSLMPRLMPHTAITILLLACCGLGFGFAWGGLAAQHALAEQLPAAAEGRDVTLIGTIDSLPHRSEQGVRFNFEVERVLPQAGVMAVVPIIPSHLALSWYSGFAADADRTERTVAPGERWQLTVRLQRPHGNANPYGFDYEVWLLEQNLRATGYVREDRDSTLKNQRLDTFVWSFGHAVEACRSWLRERIMAALPGKPYAGVLVALVVGDQRGVSQSDWAIFNRTGISHLISISGLHITMIAGLFASLVFWLWRHSFFTGAQLPLRLPAQKAAALAGAGMALLYVLLAGFGVPAQRTLYMISVVAAALWAGRITSVSHVLCLALAAVLLLDPWAVLWPGFWLSFGAVGAILYSSVGRTLQLASDEAPTPLRKWRATLAGAARTQYAITLGLVPLTLLLFSQVSLVSPIANALAIPLVSLLVTPLALLGSVLPMPLATWVLGMAHGLIEWLALFLGWLNALPLAVWSAPTPAPWIFLLALAGAAWLLAPRGWPVRWLGLMGWLPLLLNVPAHPGAGQMWITAFDVGQGMALLVETERHRLLYDTGPFYSAASNGGNRVILPYLKARGIGRLDAVVVTHNDSDHAGGALSIFDGIQVDWVASSLAPETAMVRTASHHRRCVAGQNWSWDGIRFEMLHPAPEDYQNSKAKSNALGCTLKITSGAQSILLPADIGKEQEARLLAADPDRLRATVLLAPHHGSGTSSSLAFLQAVQPQLALFQVGYRNRYGHPKQEVFERYGNLGIQRLRNDEAGAITLQFGSSFQFSEYRTEHARYWHGR